MTQAKKVTRCDLHVHTNYSFDSSVTMEQYAERARKLGIDVLCFTDHIDINRHYDTFKTFDFDGRFKEFERVKKQFEGEVLLLLGFEMGEPHLHPKETAFLRSLAPDMIIGSIHYPLDYEAEGVHLSRREYERLYDRYVREMVCNGDFDVLGHMDLPKKYHYDFVEHFDYVCETLRLCVERGIVPEINTASLRNGVPTTMPSMDAIRYYVSVGGKFVTINSDSHSVDNLGYNYGTVLEQLPEGVATCHFVKGKVKL